MKLSLRIIDQSSSPNDFTYVDQAEVTEGNAYRVYFQLTDISKDVSVQAFKPAGRRYMAATGSSLQVTLDNIDDDIKIVRAAVQPYSNDTSTWYISVLATDKIRGTINMLLKLTEGSVVTYGRAEAVVAADGQGCF